MTINLPTLPVRPPRPRVPTTEVLERAAAWGVRPEDMNTGWITDEGDLAIESGLGVVNVYVAADRPDGAGQSGVLLLHGAPSCPEPRGIPKFVPRDVTATDYWTANDLDWAGRTLRPPAHPEHREDGMSGFGSWVFGGDGDAPVRARRLWREIAKRNSLTLEEAVSRIPLARTCRQLIRDSGWLSEREAKQL